MTIILWALAIISAIVIGQIIWWYVRDKIFFWWSGIKIHRMAKKYKGTETGNRLQKLADDMKQFAKESKLQDYIDGEE